MQHHGPVRFHSHFTVRLHQIAAHISFSPGNAARGQPGPRSHRTLRSFGLGLDKIAIRKVDKPLSHFQRPVSDEDLAGYGLDGWAVDYLDGPEPVLAMLCDNSQLHRAAISLRSHNPRQFAALKSSPINIWIAGKELNKIIRRREYDAEAANVTILKSARFWTSGETGVSTAETDLQRTISELQASLEELEAKWTIERGNFYGIG